MQSFLLSPFVILYKNNDVAPIELNIMFSSLVWFLAKPSRQFSWLKDRNDTGMYSLMCVNAIHLTPLYGIPLEPVLNIRL